MFGCQSKIKNSVCVHLLAFYLPTITRQCETDRRTVRGTPSFKQVTRRRIVRVNNNLRFFEHAHPFIFSTRSRVVRFATHRNSEKTKNQVSVLENTCPVQTRAGLEHTFPSETNENGYGRHRPRPCTRNDASARRDTCRMRRRCYELHSDVGHTIVRQSVVSNDKRSCPTPTSERFPLKACIFYPRRKVVSNVAIRDWSAFGVRLHDATHVYSCILSWITVFYFCLTTTTSITSSHVLFFCCIWRINNLSVDSKITMGATATTWSIFFSTNFL